MNRNIASSVLLAVGLTRAIAAGDLELRVEAFDAAASNQPAILAIPEINQPPALDGKLDDAAWTKATVIKRLVDTDGRDTQPRTTVYAAFDAKHIYIAFDCEEPAMDRLNIRAKEGEDWWPGDAVDVSIDLGRTRKNFYQFVTNSVGAHNDYANGSTGVWWDTPWQTKSGRTATGWCAEMAIPWQVLSSEIPQRETVCGVNFTRHRALKPAGGAPGEESVQTWLPTKSRGNPRLFGAMFFGTPERLAGYNHHIQIEGTLDKFTYTRHHPWAQLVVNMNQGEPKHSSLDVQLLKKGVAEPMGQSTAPMAGPVVGMEMPLADLALGSYVLRVQGKSKSGEPSRALELPFDLKDAPKVATSGEITLRRTQDLTKGIDRWHARTGVAFPEGALWKSDQVALFTADGKPVPVQVRSLATWSKGGAIKWASLDFQLPLSAQARETLKLRFGPDVKATSGGELKIAETDLKIAIDTGAARFVIRRQGFNFIDEMTVGERAVLKPSGAADRGPYMADEAGKKYWGSLDKAGTVVVEEQNPMRAVVRAEGFHVDERGAKLGRYVMRLYFYSGVPYFRTQHTFIITEDSNQTRYSDIGLLLPIAGAGYAFGTSGEPQTGSVEAGRSVSLLQKRWDQYAIHVNADQPAPLAAGDKAPGWVARGGVAVVVRDFWQNFPKELEADAAGLTVHFWPRHGQRVWSEEEEVQPEHAYMLPFVHQGKLLDFKMPESYFAGPLAKEYGFSREKDGKWELYYGLGAQRSNAMGVGKTHDLLIAFGDVAKPEKLSALRDAFQTDAHFLADPNWTCATEVVGPMAPVDAERFPYQEAYISDGFDFLMRWTFDATHAYGMFNYGDSYHVFRKQGDPSLAPGYYRLWAGYHHGRARVPWLFYLRSGDPKYFAWGRANSQRLIDVSTCHYTTPQFDTQGDDAGKLVGGLADYKGIVPWHSGNRVGDYNNMIDFILLDYYLTGNGRALDVAHETGQLLIRHARGKTSREAASLGALLHYYQHTWNPQALLAFTTELPNCYKLPAYQHYPASVQWGPYVEPWIAYSNDPAAKKFLMELADTLLDRERSPMGMHYYGDGRALAMASTITGDPKYVRHGWGFYNSGPGLVDLPGSPFDGFSDWLNYSFETQQMLPLMAQVRDGEPITMDQPRYGGRGMIKMHLHESPVGEVRAVIHEAADTEFWINDPRLFTRKNLNFELLNPRGEVVQSGEMTTAMVDNGGLKVTQKQDGVTGDYTFRLFGPDEYMLNMGLCSLGTQRFVVPELKSTDEFIVQGRMFFYVPPACEKFRFTVSPVSLILSQPVHVMVFDIISPEDRLFVTRTAADNIDPRVIEVEVPEKWRGKVWSIAARNCRLINVEGVPRWLAATYQGAAAAKDAGAK
jgi:hypothetical protein